MKKSIYLHTGWFAAICCLISAIMADHTGPLDPVYGPMATAYACFAICLFLMYAAEEKV